MTWILGEAKANAAAIVKDFTDTFYTPPAFNTAALIDRIASAIRQAEDAACQSEAISRARKGARSAGRIEGIELAAEFLAGVATANNSEVVVCELARRFEQGVRALAGNIEQHVRALT